LFFVFSVNRKLFPNLRAIKENKKASTKKCINVESGKKGALYLELEWRRWKAQWANSLPLLILKFGGKLFLKVP